jgi:predicted secreted hydrolase
MWAPIFEMNRKVAFAAIGILVTACGNESVTYDDIKRASPTGVRYLTGAPAVGFDQVLGVRDFKFPEDHGAHPEFQTEWWYFTGNLFDAEERHFGFELTFFRYGLIPETSSSGSAWSTGSVWMANFAVTDTNSREFYSAERLSRGHQRLAHAVAEPFTITVEDWRADAVEANSVKLTAGTDQMEIDLTLQGLDRIVLQGDRGFDPRGPERGNASHYYSAPSLVATGTISVGGAEEIVVSGGAWLDREWGTSALSEGVLGWDWFALQLEDGRDLMYYRLRQSDGGTSPFSGGSIVDEKGGRHRLGAEDVILESTQNWRSPESEVVYPVRWRMRIPSLDLELTVQARIPNQEIDLSVRYWEGAVSVSGSTAGEPISGNGYLELAGY